MITYDDVGTTYDSPSVTYDGGEVDDGGGETEFGGSVVSRRKRRAKLEEVRRLPDDAEAIATAVLLLW